MDEDTVNPKDEAAWFDLNFVPQWARKPPGDNPYAGASGSPEPERTPRHGGPRGRPRSAGLPPRRAGSGAHPRDRRKGEDRRRTSAPPARSEPRAAPVRLPVDISFIPERAALHSVARRIEASQRAFPLLDLAVFFLSKDAFHEIKIEVRREDPDAEGFQLVRCRMCGSASSSRAALVAHAAAEHSGELLESEVVEEEPPSGQFVCIARCRLGGHLVGPPNHHLYAERLATIRREHFPRMSEEDFHAQLETVRDPELIEQWKEHVRRRHVYRRKDDPEAEPMNSAQAQAWLESTVSHTCIQAARRCIIPAHIARATKDPGLRRALGEAWAREERFPRTMLMALRPAFRHLGLRLFRAGTQAWFVTAIAPSAVEPEHAIEPVRRILEHIAAHPGIRIGPMLEALQPGSAASDPECAELLRHLKWLVGKGHVIEFSDGALSVPRKQNPDSRKARG